jgi:tetratricopeptide (TPR) repeat protein
VEGEVQLPAALSRLCADPSRLSVLALWRALPVEDRKGALVGALAAGGPPPCRAQLVAHVVRQRSFRPQTVVSWPDEKLATLTAQGELQSVDVARKALQELHLRDRSRMLCEFLDLLEVPHDDRGRISIDLPRGAVATDEALTAAADHILDRFPAAQVCVYLLTLQAFEHSRWSGLTPWLGALPARIGRAAPFPERAADELADQEVASPEPPPSLQDFTTFDRVLIRAIIDAAQGIEGALGPDELDDMIEETVQLNSSRHRTFFHVGFRDAVFDRPLRAELPAQNGERRAAYWSGYLQGLGRRERWSAIVHLFDEHTLAGWFGPHAQGATAFVLFQAMRHVGRSNEVAALLLPAAVVTSPPLRLVLLEEGTHLLREDRAAEARTIFDLLAEAIPVLEQLGHDTAASFYQDARRRRANCYRQLGELAFASRLLEELLHDAPDETRPMVLADLGLIEAGIRRLAELTLPATPDGLPALAAALTRGEARFREALHSDAPSVGHASYCLGVLALASDRAPDAVRDLELALSLFESRASVYRIGGLLPNARLYLGIAICKSVEVSRLRRAGELVRQAVRDGAQIPAYLLTETLTALSLAEDAAAREVAEEILRRSSPDVLDSLLDADVAADSQPIAGALLARAMDETRGTSAQRRDAVRVLPLLLRQGRTEDAGMVLDLLEEAALRGHGAEEYMQLLEMPDRFEPALSGEDATWSRVAVLEAAGRYGDAAAILAEEFHRVLSDGSTDDDGEAEGIRDRILSYGTQEAVVAGLDQRLQGVRRARGSAHEVASTSTTGIPVRIVVVGGNERQQVYDDPIRQILRTTDPGITVEFIHPGWSGHWNGTLEDVKRSLARSDGAVVMRLTRTMFGRQVRAACSIPWRGCGGSGRQAIIDSILAAAGMARRHLASRTFES